MFRDAVREFAETDIRPHVHAMDEAAQFRPDLIPKFFELGLMGIEVPEEYGGSGGTIFMAVLAIEELARVDASAAIYVDVHNTLVNNAILRWATPSSKARYFPRLTSELLGAFALSEPGSGSDAFALATRAERRGDDWVLTGTQVLDHQRGRGRTLYRLRQRRPFQGLQGDHRLPGRAGISRIFHRQEGKQARHSGLQHHRADPRGMRRPPENVLGPVGQGYKISIETLNEGRIGSAPDDRGGERRAPGGHRLREGAAAVRQADCRIPGGPVPAGPDGHRPRGGPADGLQRRPAQGRGQPFAQQAAMAKLFSSQVADALPRPVTEYSRLGYSLEYP